MKKLLSVLVLILAATLLQAQEQLKIVKISSSDAPVIDGRTEESCWGKVPWNQMAFLLHSMEPPKAGMSFKACHDGNYIYVAAKMDEPSMSTLKATPYTKGSALIWLNDSIEVNFVYDDKCLFYYKTMIDVTGNICDLRCRDDNTGTDKYQCFSDWSSGVICKISRGENFWQVEAAFPMGAMDYPAETSSKWRFNIGRNRNAVNPMELSATSKISTPSHMVPKEFDFVEIEDFALRPFRLELDELAGSFDKNRAGQFVYSFSTTIHNLTGDFKILNLELELSNEKTQKRSTRQITIDGNEYKKVTVDTVLDEPGEYLRTFTIYANASRPMILKRHSELVQAFYVPLDIKLIRPPYRNNIYATMKDKSIEANVVLREYIGQPLTVELLGADGKCVLEQRIPSALAENKVQWDGAKLPEGKYILSVKAGKNGESGKSMELRVLPYRKNEVWFDAQGITYVDGKRFLPFGWYGGQPDDISNKPWINSLLLLTPYGTIEEARKDHENTAAKGQFLMAFPFQELPGKSWQPRVIFKDPDTRRKGLTPEQRQKIVEYITAIRDVDGILGYYMADEPECRDNNPVWYEEARDLISELDPYHPCIMLNWGMEGIKKYYKGADVLLPDCYPQYFEDGSTGHARWCSSDWAKTSSALRPAWQMPLMTLWPNYSSGKKLRGIPPTYFDQRSQFFQAIIHNVKGFNMYSYPYAPWYSSLIFGPDAIGETLHILKDFILPNTIPGAVEYKVEPQFPHFQAGLKIEDGKVCLIATNPSLTGRKVSFKLKKPVGSVLYVAGEGRSVNIQGNTFVDVFAPNETHIYINDAKLADAVPSVPAIVEKIEQYKKDRRKPGNLLATGELLGAQYEELADGKNPENFPVLTASSDAIFYVTREIGSMLFLIDGIVDPLRLEMAWSPNRSDAKPWLNVKMNAKHQVKMIKLYTPMGNLKSGRIIAGGKNYDFKDNKDQVISIALDGDLIDSFKLEVLSWSCDDNAAGASKRLLTEIEAF